jgi:hypothetical protein
MPWSTREELESELRARAVPIVRCIPGLKKPHSVKSAASFIPCRDRYIRLDWQREPTREERQEAVNVIREGCPGPGGLEVMIDAECREYPGNQQSAIPRKLWKLSPLLGYYWPAVWLKGRPGPDSQHLDIAALHDIVYEGTLAQGIRAKAYRLGLFVFDFSNWEAELADPPVYDDEERGLDQQVPRAMRRIRVFNAHLACFYDAIARLQQGFCISKVIIQYEETISMRDFGDPLSGMAWSSPRLEEVRPRFHTVLPPDDPERWHWSEQFRTRFVVKEETLKESFSLLTAVLDHSSDHTLLLTELLAHSCKAFEDHEYSLSLIVSWAITEKLLQCRWSRYLSEERQNKVEVDGEQVPLLTKEREKKLTDGNQFTASVTTEFLTCLGLLPFKLYQRLNRVRNARNHWMHELQPVSWEAASDAIRLAQEMLREVEGVNFSIPVLTRFHN